MINKAGLFLLVIILFLTGCEFGLDPEAEAPGAEQFVELFDTSYEVELQGNIDPAVSLSSSALGGAGGIGASATASADHLGDSGIPTGSSVTVSNYPEPGLASEIEVGEAGSNLQITVRSTPMGRFESSFIVEETVERYYVVDSDNDGLFDPEEVGMILQPDGTSGEHNWGNLYRELFADYFADGSVRKQVIVNSKAADADLGFAAFDVAGSMEFPSGSYSPAASDQALWSSVVTYYHALDETLNFWFLNGEVEDPTTVGIRYYTEHADADGGVVGTTYALEVVVGSVNGSVETLAENVIRKEVSFDENGVAIDRRARMEMVIRDQVNGEGMVFSKNGRDLSRLPARAQQAQLRHVEQSATLRSDANWGDIEIRLR